MVNDLNMPLGYITEFVRGKYGKEVHITIIYEDRPAADFNSLFRALSGLLGYVPFLSTVKCLI